MYSTLKIPEQFCRCGKNRPKIAPAKPLECPEKKELPKICTKAAEEKKTAVIQKTPAHPSLSPLIALLFLEVFSS